jgi:type I restriction enzyme S subunit
VTAFGEHATLSKLSVNPLTSPSTIFEHYSLPAFDANRMPALDRGEAIKSNKTRVPAGAVLQSKLNPHIPRVWFLGDVGDDAICSTEFLPWMAQEMSSPELIYCVLSSAKFQAQVGTLVTGTSNSHQRVRPDQVSALPMVSGTDRVRSTFSALVRPMLRKVVANRYEVQTLAEVRDTLLPRLISGKLRLPESKELVVEALA